MKALNRLRDIPLPVGEQNITFCPLIMHSKYFLGSLISSYVNCCCRNINNAAIIKYLKIPI